MNIMKKRISLVLGIIMLALAIIPVINVNAAETCQVTMTVKMGNTTLANNGKYTVKGGEQIVVNASSSKAGIAFIGYAYNDDPTIDVFSNKATITVPQGKAGTETYLYIEAVATNDNGKANTITKTGWMKYTLVYEDKVESTYTKAIEVKHGNKVLSRLSKTEAKVGDTIIINATPSQEVENLQYRWSVESSSTKVTTATKTITIPSNFEAGKTYALYVNAKYKDGLYVDGKELANTVAQTYYFNIVSNVTNNVDRKLDIEPWMEENDDTEELVVSLRNDSEKEGKANKNIYELNEAVTYYIDYKNGGRDIDDKVTVRLFLPLDFSVVDYNGGKLNEDDEIEWVFDGLEEGEAGTIIVKVKYTDLKKSRDDANTIYPSAEIAKGKKVKDVSTVINYIITEYNEELDIEHDPYMYGDADSDTFRPDYIITRAEGALVLARIFGLDYQNVKTITTKYSDINTTYLEAQKAITAASNAGLINGYEDGTYRPNEKMTKAQFMKILACMIQEGAKAEDIEGLEIKGFDKLIKNYDDAKRYYIYEGKRVYTHWAIEEISLLARLNMLPLNEDNNEFELDETITRAEVAQLINFYLLRAPAEVTSRTKTGFSDVSRKHDLAGDIIEATRATHTFSITTEATEVKE